MGAIVRVPDPSTPRPFEHNINMGHSIRGFFEVGCSAKDPGELQQ